MQANAARTGPTARDALRLARRFRDHETTSSSGAAYQTAALAALHLVVVNSKQGCEPMAVPRRAALPACTGEWNAVTGADLQMAEGAAGAAEATTSASAEGCVEGRVTVRRFPSRVTVVSALRSNDLHAMTTGSSTTISLDPLLVLVAVSCGGPMHDLLSLRGGRWRNVNIFGDCEDVNLRLLFAHELPTNTVSEPSDGAIMRSHTI